MRSVHQQRFLTLSQHQKKVVADSFEVHLKVSKQLFQIFHFFDWIKLDELKWQNQHVISFASVHLENCQRTLHMRQQNPVKIVFFASVCCACGNTLLAHTGLTVAYCQRILRILQQFASVCSAYSSNLLAYTAHMVTNCQIFCALLAYAAHAEANASLCFARGSNLLAQTAHVVAKTKGPYLTHL